MKNAQRLAFATAATTMLLIAAGVLVRATGSGLGCPDWPTCHGVVTPPSDHHGIIEISHRYLGTIVGVLVILTAVMAWRHYRTVPFVTWTATAAVPLVGIQGLLGAITVVRELPPEIVATHLVTAMLVLGCELAVAWAMYVEDRTNIDPTPPPHRLVARGIGLATLATLGWLAVVMWVGGYMAESGAATACEGWPLCNGGAFPGADDQEVTHMLHRYLAGLLVVPLALVLMRLWRSRAALSWARPILGALVTLYVAQVTVGALNVFFTFPDPLTVAHTVIASAIWFTLASAAMLGFYTPAEARQRAATLRAGELPV